MNLEAPKLLFTETISEVSNEYIYTIEDHPELENCRWLLVEIEQPSTPSSKPYLHFCINKKAITQVAQSTTGIAFKADSTTGFWVGCGASMDNARSIIDVRGNVNFLYSTIISDFVKYESIKSISLWSYTQVLSVGATVKVYGC